MNTEEVIKYINELELLLDNCTDELWQIWYKKQIEKFKSKVKEV